jgi:transposase InsO family protein
VATVSCRGTSGRYRFIEKLRAEVSVVTLLRLLGVSKSGYYDWRQRQPSAREIEDGDLKVKIQQIFTENKGRYGSPRIFHALKKQGYNIGKKRIERLYKALNLVARVMRVTYRSVGSKRFLATGENLRPGGEVPNAKNKVWVADVTYLKVKGVWRYLSVIMDLYSRRIISWSLDRNRTMEVTKRTLKKAIKKRQPEGNLMLHTDRGIEYRGHIYQAALKCGGIVHSLSRAGKCTDNAHMESFFHSMKAEVIRGNVFKSDADLRGTLGSYINKYYNATRLHSGINYCSPMEYEAIAA